MRQVVRAVLPLGKGTILDPFMGAGSTIAAANALGYESAGVELDKQFFGVAQIAIPKLTALKIKEAD
jgi:site-specific DNA-methyltransferase (adenine-specific)